MIGTQRRQNMSRSLYLEDLLLVAQGSLLFVLQFLQRDPESIIILHFVVPFDDGLANQLHLVLHLCNGLHHSRLELVLNLS